jgi:UDP-3-O-[3-hydroxymyristoyl] glucosamine N-acyltransferase
MISLVELADLLGAELTAPSTAPMITRVSSIPHAAADSIVFAEDDASFVSAIQSQAAAVLVSRETARERAESAKPILYTPRPRHAFAKAAKILESCSGSNSSSPHNENVHPTAAVAANVRLGENVKIGPFAVIEEHVSIGQGTQVGSGAVIGRASTVGSGCRIFPRAVLYPGTELGDRVVVHAGAVLGADGFGYVRDDETGEYLQFPQQGKLVIENDVEIGANTTIDRGALEETRIARGAKLDNLVHVGHNVSVGRNAVIAAQTGISGSSSIGNNAILGGQVGIGDHAAVGDGVILGGQAGILPRKKIRGSGILFWGTPAQPVKKYLRQLAALARLSRSASPSEDDGGIPSRPRAQDHGLED